MYYFNFQFNMVLRESYIILLNVIKKINKENKENQNGNDLITKQRSHKYQSD